MAEPDKGREQASGRVILSVCICTYNREKFLPDALESIAGQTASLADYELLIVNNNSTDNTDAICRQFIDRHPGLHVRYLIETRQGLSHARNRGIAEARGRYLTFIDDDAVAKPDFVEQVIRFFKSHPAAVAAGGRVLARFERERPDWFNPYSASLFFSHYDKGDQLFQYEGRGYPIGCNMSFRHDFLEESGGFDTELGRKGKDGIGAEEKAVFARMIEENLPYYYDPSQVVYHQIDEFRTQPPYTRKLARGLGETHHKLYCKDGFSTACIQAHLLMWLKFFAALLLALSYLVQGRPAVSRHLIWYRWTVIKGFLS